MIAESCSSFFNYPGVPNLSLEILPIQSYGSLKLLSALFLRWAKTQNYFSSPSRLGSLTLKLTVFKDVYLHPVASEANGWRMLNTNQLHDIE